MKTNTIFDHITDRAFAYVILLFVSSWVPLGLHRIWMKQKCWWLFPLAYAIGIFAVWKAGLFSPQPEWDFITFKEKMNHIAIFVLPYPLLVISDLGSVHQWSRYPENAATE